MTTRPNERLTPLTTVDVMGAAHLINQTQSLLAMAVAIEFKQGLTIKVELSVGGGANPTLFLEAVELADWLDNKTTYNLEALDRLGVDTSQMLLDYKQLAESIKAKQQSGTPLDNRQSP